MFSWKQHAALLISSIITVIMDQISLNLWIIFIFGCRLESDLLVERVGPHLSSLFIHLRPVWLQGDDAVELVQSQISILYVLHTKSTH